MTERELLAGLDPDQQNVVLRSLHRNTLVVAAPGSGKTRVLTTRIAVLLTQGVRPDQIVGVTFTTKAAAQMRERLEAMIGEPAKQVRLSTIHSLCLRILRRFGSHIDRPSGWWIADEEEARDILKEVLDSLGALLTDRNVGYIQRLISRWKAQRILPEAALAEAATDPDLEVAATAYEGYQRLLEKRCRWDFDDLLLDADRLLEFPLVRATYHTEIAHLLVDEYQDTSPLEIRILRHLAGPQTVVFAVGDPRQSIYGFRGASLEGVSTFTQMFPSAQVLNLSRNYRSTQIICQAANALMVGTKYTEPMRSQNGVGIPLRLYGYELLSLEAEGIAETIAAWAKEKGTFRELAVLARTHRVLGAIESALRHRGIPVYLAGGTPLWERKEVKDVLSTLRLIVNPDDAEALKRVLPLFPGVGKQLAEMLEAFREGMGILATEALKRFVPRRKHKAYEAAKQALSQLPALRNLPPTATLEQLKIQLPFLWDVEEERLDHLGELETYLQQWQAHEPDPTLARFVDEATLIGDTPEVADAVFVGTIHAAKGLEWDRVVVMGAVQGLIPHVLSQGDREAAEEEKRLFYVALTRARKEVALTWHRFRAGPHGELESTFPSVFLDLLPPELLVRQDIVEDSVA